MGGKLIKELRFADERHQEKNGKRMDMVRHAVRSRDVDVEKGGRQKYRGF